MLCSIGKRGQSFAGAMINSNPVLAQEHEEMTMKGQTENVRSAG
jgi:hypothetical protein